MRSLFQTLQLCSDLSLIKGIVFLWYSICSVYSLSKMSGITWIEIILFSLNLFVFVRAMYCTQISGLNTSWVVEFNPPSAYSIQMYPCREIFSIPSPILVKCCKRSFDAPVSDYIAVDVLFCRFCSIWLVWCCHDAIENVNQFVPALQLVFTDDFARQTASYLEYEYVQSKLSNEQCSSCMVVGHPSFNSKFPSSLKVSSDPKSIDSMLRKLQTFVRLVQSAFFPWRRKLQILSALECFMYARCQCLHKSMDNEK